jgi:hypothetical protein
LGESNIVKDIDSGFIATGQNWNGKDVTQTQKEVLQFFGFKTPDQLFWNWQYTQDANDESLALTTEELGAWNTLASLAELFSISETVSSNVTFLADTDETTTLTTTEAALHMLEIPIIYRDLAVEYVATSPPAFPLPLAI